MPGGTVQAADTSTHDTTGLLRFLPPDTEPWLGQIVPIAVQFTDQNGRGLTSQRITCVSSDGLLSAREGLQIQNGAAVSLQPEPGGLVRFTIGPRLFPPLDPAASAALAAALAGLTVPGEAQATTGKELQLLAALYRGEGSGALQTAIDRLFEAFPAEGQRAGSPWPVHPVTLLALAEDSQGQITNIASLTLRTRNWLGAFYTTLGNQITENSLLPQALKNLTKDAKAGRDLSRPIVQATLGYSGLERGVIGRKLREANIGTAVARFLDDNAQNLKGTAIINAVRAAGTSEAAIASGGLAVFDAIRNAQGAADVIKRPLETDFLTPKDLQGLIDRLVRIEKDNASLTDLSRTERNLSDEMAKELKAAVGNLVSQSDVDRLQGNLDADFKKFDSDLDKTLGSKMGRDEFDKIFSEFKDDIEKTIGSSGEPGPRDDLKEMTEQIEKRQIDILQRLKKLEGRRDNRRDNQ